MESKKEILVRTQDGCTYRRFEFPIEVIPSDVWNRNEEEHRHGYVLIMGYTTVIGEYEEKRHAIHVMNYLIAKRNYYQFDDVSDIKSIIINVPSDELVKQTADENLLDGVPVEDLEKADEEKEN